MSPKSKKSSRWPYVLLALLGVVSIGLVGLDLFLKAMLARQEMALRVAGVPTTAEDLGLTPVAPENNAATLYREAVEASNAIDVLEASEEGEAPELWEYRDRFRAMHANPCRERTDDEKSLVPLTEAELAQIDAWFAEFQPTYEELERAWFAEKTQWSDYSTLTPDAIEELPGSVLPGLATARELARQLAFKASWEQARGNTEAALESIALGMHLANGLADEPLLISGLVRIAAGGIALNALEDLLAQSDTPPAIPARLQAELDAFREASIQLQFLDGERRYMSAVSAYRSNFISRLLVYTPNQIKLNEYHLILRDAINEPDFQRRRAILAPLEAVVEREKARRGGLRWPFHVIANMSLFPLLDSFEANDRLLAQAHLAEQVIALKQYKQENGAYPDSLEAIADRLGGELPQDPFSGEPFRYERDGDGFRLSSVGKAGKRDIGWCGDR